METGGREDPSSLLDKSQLLPFVVVPGMKYSSSNNSAARHRYAIERHLFSLLPPTSQPGLVHAMPLSDASSKEHDGDAQERLQRF